MGQDGEMSFWSTVKKYSVPGLVAVYLTVSLLGCGWLLLDVSTRSFSLIKWLGIALPISNE